MFYNIVSESEFHNMITLTFGLLPYESHDSFLDYYPMSPMIHPVIDQIAPLLFSKDDFDIK